MNLSEPSRRLCAAAFLASCAIGARAAAQTQATVVVGDIDGAIGPVSTTYVERLIALADERDASCLVLRMDTPGGLSASMRDVIQAVLASPVPVVVYVWPEGAHAASAGALIALSAHVVAMAPGTNIGAAHPVSIGAGEEENDVMDEKVTNDAAAYARSLADRRGRSVEWAECVVRESISSTAEEAVAEGVADFVAADLAELLARVDGRRTSTPAGEVVIRASGAAVEVVPATFRERFLARISDPNIAYVLMLVGVFGIIFELQNPGSILPGVAGAVSLVTAAFALQMLPISWTGVALIALAIAMFILEIKVASHGLLTIGGVVSMVIGSIMLIDSPLPFMRVSLAVIIPSVAFTALFFLFAVGMGIKAQRRKVTTGSEGLVGEVGTARTAVAPEGTVFVRGELWSAHSDEPLAPGDAVEVIAVDGMKVNVRRRPGA
ncbi:MAG: nodulation protein NfeD [Candidatus Latescibacteria bacterium]|nr:nodulation protein NfeD [Candidatus Latescibacterota bacterium]